jgi:urocanate hydratase
MEYIPDGLSKKQWEQIKKKEAEELKAKVRTSLTIRTASSLNQLMIDVGVIG